VAWSLVFLSFLHRAGPALGLGKTGAFGWSRFLSGVDLAFAVAAGALVFAAALAAARGPTAAVLVAAALVAMGSSAGDDEASRALRATARPDVLVILIDTWRFDHLGFHGNGVGAVAPEVETPVLDALARRSVVFRRAYAPSNLTRRSMPGILTSFPWSVTRSRPLSEQAYTLAELLRDAGYGTYGISANPNVAAQFGYEQGFDVFVDPSLAGDFLVTNMLQILGTFVPGPAYGAGVVSAALYYRPASELRRRGIGLLSAAGSGPSFLYLHTMDPHGPYLPPREHLPEAFRLRDFYSYYDFEKLRQKDVLNSGAFRPHLENLLQRYAGEVRFTDAELGRLIQQLREAGRWEETLVWITSDHGEAFGEHDHAGHGGPHLTSVLTHVPFLVKPPRSWGIEPRTIDETVSNYDLLPTTAGLLGLPAPEGVFGEDLSAVIRHGGADPARVVISYAQAGETTVYAAVRGPWKLVVRAPEGGPPERELFHLQRDPAESQDVLDAHPDLAMRLEQEIDAWRRNRTAHDLPEGEGRSIDPAMEERLRALGYVDDDP
jgi:arylsulfatase A-like enzyme